MIIYEILTERDNETMLLYKEWDVQENFPVPANFTKISPPKKYHREKFDFMLNGWVEDVELLEKESIEEVKKNYRESLSRIEILEDVMLNLLMMEVRE